MNTVFAVHSMGRVGSLTLAHSLFGQGYAAVHTHNFGGDVNPFELTTKYLLESYRHFDTKLWVISPVRDIVARNLSVYSHTIPNPNLEGFLNYPYRASESWMLKELVGYWGVQVFDEPFDRERGWQAYDIAGENAKLMIYQLERLDEVWTDVWRFMMGKKKVPTIYRVGESHVPTYKKWKLPSEYLDKVYESLVMRTFYTQPDIEIMRSKHESQ